MPDSILPAAAGDYSTDLDRATQRATAASEKPAPDAGLGGAATLLKEQETATREAGARIKAREGSIEKIIETMPTTKDLPAPPKLAEIGPQPQYQGTEPLQKFGSIAGMLGIIGSVATRGGLTGALEASTAAMTAIDKNDLASYGRAVDAWKLNSDHAFKVADWENGQYKNAIDLMKTNFAQGEAKLRMLAAMNQDDQMLATLQTGNISNTIQLVNARSNLATQFLQQQGVKQQLTESQEKWGAFLQWKLDNPNASPEQAAVKRQQILSGQAPTLGAEEGLAVEDLVRQGVPRVQAIQKVEEAMRQGKKPDAFGLAYAAEQQRRAEAGEPPMTGTEISQMAADTNRGEATTVKARKDAELGLKQDRAAAWERVQTGKLKQNEEKIVNTEEYRKTFFELKRRGLDDSEAHQQALEKHWQDQTDTALKRLANTPAAMKSEAVRQVISQQEAERGRDLTGEEKLQIINNSNLPADQSVKETAKLIANYQLQPMSGYSLRSPFGQAVMAEVGKINPAYSQARYNEVNRAVVSFGTGKQGDTTRSFNVAIAHLQTLDDLGQALATGDVKGYNRVSQMFQEQFGQPAPGNFEAAKQIVGDEIIKAIVGSGGGVTERAEAEGKIAAAKSPQQLKEITQTYRQLMLGQLNGLRHQYKETTGLDNFDDKLLPETRQALTRTGQSTPADIGAKATAAWGIYDPDRYDYRIDPGTGQLQRKAK